jgi:ABC-type branched-subunit amino acid transport system ATPase component
VLNFGQVIATGSPGVISTNPDVLAAYLGVDT